MNSKICTRCHIEKSLDDFHKNHKGILGRVSRCKLCVKEVHGLNHESIIKKQREYQAINRGRRNQERKEFHLKNHTEDLAKMKIYGRSENGKKAFKKYRKNNLNKLHNIAEIYRNTHKEYYREKEKEYRQSVKGKLNKKRLNNKRRALKKVQSIPYTIEELQMIFDYFNNSCAYCNDNQSDLTIDHVIPISKSGFDSIQNIVPACRKCNLSKSSKNMETWFRSKSFFTEESLEKINAAYSLLSDINKN